MRQLPDEFTRRIKDGLRGARYVVRRGARLGQDAVAFAPGVPDIASLTDTVLTATERTASVLLHRKRPDFDFPGTVLDAYAATLAEADPTQRKRLFVRLQYRLIEAVLRRLGVPNVFISEHEIALAYDGLQRRGRRNPALPRASREPRPDEATRFWVAAAVTLGVRHPLREIDLPRAADARTSCLERAPAPYCLLVAALTGAILTTRDNRAGDDGLDATIDSAAAVVTARFDRLAEVFTKPGAVETLVREFAAVLPFLP